MWTIVLRELTESLKNRHFLFFMALSIILFAANGLIFSKLYNSEQSRYNYRVNNALTKPTHANIVQEYSLSIKNKPFITNSGPRYPCPSTISTELYRSPSPLLFIAEGKSKYRPYGYIVRPGGMWEQLSSNPRNEKLPDILEIDWIFIIGIIFTLFAILISFNTVSGEREQGTLSLVLSNTVSRAQFLASKYIAYIIIIMVPVILGMAINILILVLSVNYTFTIIDITRILIVLLATFLFVSIFILLSILISSSIRNSSLVLLLLLSCWLFFVIQPHITAVGLQHAIDIPSEVTLTKQVESIIQDFSDIINNNYNNPSSPAFAGYLGSEDNAKKILYPLMNKTQKRFVMLYSVYENSVIYYLRKTRNLNRFFPPGMFQHIAENASYNGLPSILGFLNDVRNFSSKYDTFIKNKQGEIVVNTREAMAAPYWEKESDTSSKILQANLPREYEGDKQDFPKFTESHPSILQSLSNVNFDIFGLIIWNILLAAVAFRVFNKTNIT